MWREAESLRDFIVEADRAGLPVPGSDVILRSVHSQADALWGHLSDAAEKSQFWPPDHLLEATALGAQANQLMLSAGRPRARRCHANASRKAFAAA